MLLNPFERRLVSGGLRRQVLRRWDLPRLLQGQPLTSGLRVLEVGCGQGFGVEAGYELLQAREVHAFDPDPEMVAVTRRRATRAGYLQASPPARIWEGCVTSIPAPDADYDAVLGLQVLHHVEAWREGVREIARVLRPGGRLLLAESLEAFLRHPLFGRWMDHPQEDRFDAEALVRELGEQGFQVQGTRGRGRWMTWISAERRD